MRIQNPLAEERTIAQWVSLVNNVSGSGGELPIRRKICKSLFNSQFDGRDGLRPVDGALNRKRKVRKNTPHIHEDAKQREFCLAIFRRGQYFLGTEPGVSKRLTAETVACDARLPSPPMPETTIRA